MAIGRPIHWVGTAPPMAGLLRLVCAIPPSEPDVRLSPHPGSASDGLDRWVGEHRLFRHPRGFIHPASGVVRFVPLPSDCPPSPCGRLSRPRTTTRALPHVRRWPKAGLLRCRRARTWLPKFDQVASSCRLRSCLYAWHGLVAALAIGGCRSKGVQHPCLNKTVSAKEETEIP